MKRIQKTSLLLLVLFAFVFISQTVFPHNIKIAEAKIPMVMNRPKVTLNLGTTVTLKVSGTKATAKWSSSNKSVATVTSKGLVTGMKFGTATITALVEGKKFTSIITVAPSVLDPMLDYSYYTPYKNAKYQKIITDALKTLTSDKDIDKDTSIGVMLLNRYNYYLREINNNNAYIGWANNRCSAVYNYYAFNRTLEKGFIDKLVKNTKAGKDAFDGVTGFFERPYYSDYDGFLDGYLIYLPKDYDPSKKYPMVVLLHGGGGNYWQDGNIEEDAFMISCEEKDVIMVCPNGRHRLPGINDLYQGKGMEDVIQAMEDAQSYYSIDKDRVYLTGYSMGGFGTWYIGSQHPELFAAVAPVSGYTSDKINTENLKDLPVYAFHGDIDPTCPVESTRTMVETLKALGGDVTYLELKGFDHGTAGYVYTEFDLLDWFLNYHK